MRGVGGFDGDASRTGRQSGRSGHGTADAVANAKAERERRRADKREEAAAALHFRAASRIQTAYRRRTGLAAARRELFPAWDAELAAAGQHPLAEQLFGLCGRLLLFCVPTVGADAERLSWLCKKLTASLGPDPLRNYCALSINPHRSANWIKQTKRLCGVCMDKLARLPKGEKHQYSAELQLLIMLTDWKCWQLRVPASVHPIFDKVVASMLAHLVSSDLLYGQLRSFLFEHQLLRTEHLWAASAFTLATRAITAARTAGEALDGFAREIATIPAFLQRVPQKSRAAVAAVWPMLVRHLATKPARLANAFDDPKLALAVMANCSDGFFSVPAQPASDDLTCFVHACSWLIASLAVDSTATATTKRGGSKTYHPIFGWISGGMAPSTVDRSFTAAEDVAKLQLAQLKPLWAPATLRQIFAIEDDIPMQAQDSLDQYIAFEPEPEVEPSPSPQSSSWSFFGSSRSSGVVAPASMPGASALRLANTVEACALYSGLCRFLPALKVDIIACIGFSLKSTPVIVALWNQLTAEGGAYKHRLLRNASDLSEEPLRPVLELFLQCGIYVFTILDDSEVYEKAFPFSLTELEHVAGFCNQLGFLLYWVSVSPQRNEYIQKLCAQLLAVLYERDSRRSFTRPQEWLIADRQVAKEFEQEVMQETPRTLQIMCHMPHVLPFEHRVLLFRQWVDIEHARCSQVRTRFTIRRTHVIEDALASLGRLEASEFKSKWIVHFINEQGLDEAGIDEQGLFRELVEISCQQIFHPDLNLFSRTQEDQRMYPCEASSVNPEHLRLFHLAGRLFGRTVFEGIVADLPFANFFLAKLLHGHAFLDDLQSLDPQLYKNLIFVKHYEGDVEDLCLTFAVDEEIFGQTTTVDLIPGGRACEVNNQNKTKYIHAMADYYMNQRIRRQCQEFATGFKEVIPDRWLRIFSTPAQLQRLVGGDENSALDLEDLKKHVNYEGGYHSRHKVIRNLWQIVEEFSIEDQGLFVKFVTSVSKPPLLGFQYLRPAFTIRYVPVDVKDKEEEGFSFKHLFMGPTQKTARLPTAATCFNTLKLPAYNKKSTLREKVRTIAIP